MDGVVDPRRRGLAGGVDTSAGARRWSGRTTAGAADLGDLGGLCSIWGIWAAAVGWLTGRPTRSALELVGLGSPRVRG